MVERIPDEGQGRREKGRSLCTGYETGSGDRRTVTEGPKSQGIKERKRAAVQKEPTLGPEEPGTADNGIRTRHESGRTHGTGQNHRANTTKLLVAKDERTNHRLR